MRKLMEQAASTSGNTFMLDGNIPPHITVLAFETLDEDRAVKLLEDIVHNELHAGNIHFASIGSFKGQMLYAEPVLNQYLHQMSVKLYEVYSELPDIKFSPYYKPFGWLPHMSICKHLDEGQMETAFSKVVKQFVPCEGVVARIGIAKTNPHRDIKVFGLN